MKRRRGDRRDSTLVRDIDSFHSFLVHLYPNRADSEVYMYAELNIDALRAYIKAKNENLDDDRYKATLFHAVVATVAKTIKIRPKLNRYVSGRRFFDRREITLSFVAKKQFTDHAEEALMILRPEDSYTMDTFVRQIVGEVRQAREGGEEYGADKILNLLQKLPVWVNRLVGFFLRRLDSMGKVPADIFDVDPNQTTVLFSNLGSIKCDAAYHHLNNFGTNSIIVTIGEARTIYEMGADGQVHSREILPIGVTIDERIADGFYFARSIKLIEHIIENPELLDAPIGDPIEYELA